ncbi:DUF969 domain-containing protein [Chromobacterium sp. IIBBL 290-4]|uniref:DUF969 domain-containing protein n=1 Tax=Chromobacterium sp. IIBBL 290-4 TaxID=2953890 RepID=UPI0020B89E1C|nr:DUF969 domain-containing protein [Chromobacterium sp. IIBBL 290-4]UTH74385.1 DUF969 domain-containing protein [Chromobacterium sp. IIBBL 290-4]
MDQLVNLWPLLGVAVVIAGFMLRLNPLWVVCSACIAAGLAAGMTPLAILAKFGQGFLKTRNISLAVLLVLPVVGLMERHGLKEQAEQWMRQISDATVSGLLVVYLQTRELTSALGLSALSGQAQVVRPMLAPMAEAVWSQQHGPLNGKQREKLRAMCAATDNIGLFFGENLFVAFSAVILMHTFLQENGQNSEALHIALWGLPTALFAFIIHAARLLAFEKTLLRLGGGEALGSR